MGSYRELWHTFKYNIMIINLGKAVEEYTTVGKYMLKAPVYKPKTMKEIYGLFTSTDDEEICTIKKNYIQ